jgi:hypothetical protein
MLKQAAYFSTFFIFFAGTFILAERTFSPVFQCCIEQDKNTHGAAAAEKNPSAFGTAISAYSRCSGEFIEAHNGGITALATIIIAAFTGTLWLSTNQQARLTRKSIELARKEFVCSQRPRLRVRNIIVSHPPKFPRKASPIFTTGKHLKCEFFVSNIGGTPAEITESLAMIFQSSCGLPMRRPYEGRNGNLLVPLGSLAPGQSAPLGFLSEEAIGNGAETIGTKVISAVRLFVMGWIEYRDDIGIVRKTAFCREFKRGPPDWDFGRFRRVGNRDYEHEE